MAKSKSTSRSTTSSKSSTKESTKPRTRSKSRKTAPKSPSSPRQNLEIIITLMFFFGFIIFGAGQCNKAKVAQEVKTAQNQPIAQAEEVKLNTEISTSVNNTNSIEGTRTAVPSTQINLPKLAQKQPVQIMEIPGATQASGVSGSTGSNLQPANGVASSRINYSSRVDTLQKYNQLWVTIDQLKLRREPNLKASVLMQIPLFDRVHYLNQKTDFSQEINLGAELVNEPWYYIQHSNGIKGWAYGAGLNFHKEKRAGVR